MSDKFFKKEKEFNKNDLIKFKDIIGYFFDFDLNINVIIDLINKNKDKYDNGIDLLLDYFYDKYKTSDDNKKIVNGLDYEGKKQVLDNLSRVVRYIYNERIIKNVYDGDLKIGGLNLKGDLMFMRVLNIDEVNGDFDCSYNKNLTSLKGSPKVVKKEYNFRGCDLRSLEGCPEEVGEFVCLCNMNLMSLEGGPKVVRGEYSCIDCNLEKLDGLAEDICGALLCLEGNKFDRKYVKKFIKDNNILLGVEVI